MSFRHIRTFKGFGGVVIQVAKNDENQYSCKIGVELEDGDFDVYVDPEIATQQNGEPVIDGKLSDLMRLLPMVEAWIYNDAASDEADAYEDV